MTRASSVKEIVDEWWKYAKPSYNYCFKAEKEKLEELIHAHLAALSSDEARMRAAEAWAAAWKQAAKKKRGQIADVLARIAWTLQENQQSVDVLTQKLISAEAQAERLAGACQGLLEQVRHDNENEATHHAVADGFDASEFGAYMPSAWHKGHAALADNEGD